MREKFTTTSELKVDESMSNTVLVNGPYMALMQPDGNFVLYKDSQVLWSSKSGNTGMGPYALSMLESGNLVIRDSTNNFIWSTNTTNMGTGPYKLMLTPNGNLSIFDAKKNILWSALSAD